MFCRKFTMLADSEESVESDEDFYFVDDNKIPSPKKKKLPNSSVKPGSQRLKVTVKGPEQASLDSEISELPSNGNSEDFSVTKHDDFARMMTTFDGFNQDNSQKNKGNDRKSVHSYKNKLFAATHAEDSEKEERSSDIVEVPKSDGNKTPGTNALSSIGDSGAKSDVPTKEYKRTDDSKDNGTASSSSIDSSSDSKSRTNQNSDAGRSVMSEENTGTIENKITTNISTVTSNERTNNGDVAETHIKGTDEQNIYENIPVEKKKDSRRTSEDVGQKNPSSLTQTELNPSSLKIPENSEIASSSRNSSEVNTRSEANQQRKKDNDLTSSQHSQNSSTSSKPLEKPQETYVTVLPGTLEQSDGNNTKSSNDGTMDGELGSESDSRFNKTGKSRGRCLSYLVVSGGEGHVDLRLKVKSKQDLKKDAQSMFLIWRVNSKI
jgi:hypothetical protein